MIASKDNQQIKHLKQLQQKKYRDEYSEYIVEGRKIVQEAIDGKEDISAIMVDESFNIDTIQLNGYEPIVVSSKIFQSISDTVTPQGILAIIKTKMPKEINSNVLFALDGIQDPGNMGTIIRTLDSAGISDLLLSNECADIYNSKVTRSTMGAIYRLNIIRTDLYEKLIELKKLGYEIITTALDTEKYYYDIDFNKKVVIVIGNEGNGVSKEIQGISNIKVKIPMLGKTESLNASVATGIVAYEYVRNKFASRKE